MALMRKQGRLWFALSIFAAGVLVLSTSAQKPFDGKRELGITPTGIIKVDERGQPVDEGDKPVDIERQPDKAIGHVSLGGRSICCTILS